MSVKDGLLAVLSMGPAYGSQMHAELETRINKRGAINAGQIYSTLDRLSSRSLVVTNGFTPDHFPLYALTPAGALNAQSYLSTAETPPRWDSMVDQVLLAASIPGADLSMLIGSHRSAWQKAALTQETSPRARAAALLSQAALDWLADVEARAQSGDLVPYPLSVDKPRRGRRPRQ